MKIKIQEADLRSVLDALEESLGYVQEEAENAQRLYGQYPTRQARIQGLKDDARKHMEAITAIREALTEQPAQQQCRTDGRCQYAIDSGAEGMGHCPKGKCVMPAQQQEADEIVRWVSAGTLFGLKRNKDKKTHVLYGEKTKVARIQISIKVIK